MREEYLRQANKVIKDPNILVNVVSRRIRQLQHEGMQPLVDTLEKLEPEDVALREIIEGKLSYELPDELLK
ncbi:MAG: DNA-directed RNA polymerase subunit omega [Candidatus Spyradosoma sp.]